MRPQRKIIADQSALKCRHMATRDDQCTSGQMCTVRTSRRERRRRRRVHAAWGRGLAGRNWGIVRRPQGPVRSARYSYFFGQVGLKKCRHGNWCNPWHPKHQTTQAGAKGDRVESSPTERLLFRCGQHPNSCRLIHMPQVSPRPFDHREEHPV